MLINKHPQRFNTLGSSLWKGIIYGEGAVGLPTRVPIVHHGRYGFGLFQRVYATNEYSTWAYFTLLEWHTLALLIMMAGALAPQLLAISGVMWLATIAAVMRSSMSSTLPPNAPWWARPAVVFLHFAQPIVRSWHRYVGRLSSRRLPAMHAAEERPMRLRRISLTQYDAYWTSNDNRGREHLLEAIEQETRSMGWNGRFHEEFQRWDMLLYGGRWCDITLCTVTEELGWPRRFTRARVELKLSRLSKLLAAAILILSLAAGASLNLLALGALTAAAMLLGASILGGVRRGLNRAQALLWRAGRRADLAAVGVEAASTPIAQHPVTPSDHDAPLELDGAEPLGT